MGNKYKIPTSPFAPRGKSLKWKVKDESTGSNKESPKPKKPPQTQVAMPAAPKVVPSPAPNPPTSSSSKPAAPDPAVPNAEAAPVQANKPAPSPKPLSEPATQPAPVSKQPTPNVQPTEAAAPSPATKPPAPAPQKQPVNKASAPQATASTPPKSSAPAPKPKASKLPPPIPVDKLKAEDPHKEGSAWGPKLANKKASYGGVVFNDKGQVLLREPAGQFGGYAWTFPKGGQDKGEDALDTALREVLEESGQKGEVVGYVPGMFQDIEPSGNHWSNDYFYLMTSAGEDKSKMDKETAGTKWVSIDEAKKLIGQSPSAKAKDRDLAILNAAHQQWQSLNESPKIPGFKEIQKLGGQSGGDATLVEDEEGNRYVLKKGSGNPERLKNEIIANNMYNAMGFPSTHDRIVKGQDGTNYKLSKWVDGETLGSVWMNANSEQKKQIKKEVQRGFVADCLMGNYDVVGRMGDNIIINSDGKAVRIDNGSALMFTARGWTKGSLGKLPFDSDVFEMEELLDADKHPETAGIFGGITEDEIKRQVKLLYAKKDSILRFIKDPDIKSTISRRLEWLNKNYGDEKNRNAESPVLAEYGKQASLTYSQQVAVHNYTGEGYKELNKQMRQCPPDFNCLKGEEKKKFDAIESAIADSKDLPEPVDVSRIIHVSQKTLNSLVDTHKNFRQWGFKFSMPSLTSTTTNLDPPITSVDPNTSPFVFRIKAKRGLYAKPLSMLKHENELILSSKAEYKVVYMGKSKIISPKNGKKISVDTVWLEQIS